MTDDPDDTVDNAVDKRLKNLNKRKPFVKGFDPRRNLKGVPKNAIEARKINRRIAAELIGTDETTMTRYEAMMRMLWTSRNPGHNKLALQSLDPKILTEQVDVTSGGATLDTKTVIIYVNDEDE